MRSSAQDFTIQDTAKGKGLFAVRDFAAGEYLLDYVGEIITAREADKRADNEYLFELENKMVIDGKEESNIARYINHSCDPNTEAIEEDGAIRFYTLRDIHTGEEFTFDYGEEHVAEFIAPYGCKCSACEVQ